MANEPMLPCPFCGGVDLRLYKSHGGPAVQCMGCGVRGVMRAIWNRRALARARDEALEEAARAAEAYSDECDRDRGSLAKGGALGATIIAERIRTLKSGEPQS